MSAILKRYQKQQHAIELLSMGFRSPIVVIETDLPSSAVRDLAKVIGDGKRASSGPLPSPNYILNSVNALAEASLFAGLYRSMGGEAIYDSIDIEVLCSAFKMYEELRSFHFGHEKIQILDINRAWVIARDLRSSTAWLKHCPEDGYYLIVEKQRVPSGCPWCSLSKVGGKCHFQQPRTWNLMAKGSFANGLVANV